MSEMMWGGRFTKAEEKNALDFNASISYDCRMYREDIAGSIAHAKMLAAHGIISAEDQEKITAGLKKIKKQIDEGQFDFSIELEDIHMNIEKRLTDDIGDAGARLHTARSRNDQCALDLHMYMKRQIGRLSEKLIAVESALLSAAVKYKDVIIPGYTHMQRAQPVYFAHHMLAYFAMLERDFKRLEDCYEACDMSPIGACALAGTTYDTNPLEEAENLHFSSVYGNSLDAVSDRDYLLQFLSFASICAMHLSRLSEEFIYWSTSEFQFIELDDGYSTGSSIMPQKKNPDMCELIRGKTGRVYGHLIGLLTVMKGLPLAYDKDMQEDKELSFDAIDTTKGCIALFTGMLDTMKFNKDVMRKSAAHGFTNATDAADYLVNHGVPFRDAHGIIGRIVLYCLDKQMPIDDMSLEELKQFSPVFEEDVYDAISMENCVNKRLTIGAPGEEAMKKVIAIEEAYLEKK